MEKEFVVNRITNVMGSCENLLQVEMAKEYSNMLINNYNLHEALECQKLKMSDLVIKLKLQSMAQKHTHVVSVK